MHCGNALKACVKPGKTVAVAVTALVPMVTATGVADPRKVDLTVIAVANPAVTTAKLPTVVQAATTGRHPMASTTAVVRGIHGVDPPLGRD